MKKPKGERGHCFLTHIDVAPDPLWVKQLKPFEIAPH